MENLCKETAVTIVQLQLLFIACVTAISCVLPGIFLVLRGVALMSDAMSHALLFGIVVMFLLIGDLHSPLLFVGATLAGVMTVVCSEILIATQIIKKDVAIGLVFPLFFSIGVILICRYATQVHLDVDRVILGELVFAPFYRFMIGGYDCGPWSLWLMSAIGVINILFLLLFYKELKLVTFDKAICLSW